jgi:hypothetical protein
MIKKDFDFFLLLSPVSQQPKKRLLEISILPRKGDIKFDI